MLSYLTGAGCDFSNPSAHLVPCVGFALTKLSWSKTGHSKTTYIHFVGILLLELLHMYSIFNLFSFSV